MTDSKSLEEIEVPTWWSRGSGMMVRRDALPADHPEHTYHYIVREFGVDPELYGIPAPPTLRVCPHCGEELPVPVRKLKTDA